MSRPADDHAAIERLLASYALLFDSEDVTGCAQLFTESCEFLLNGDVAATAREGVAGLDEFLERKTFAEPAG